MNKSEKKGDYAKFFSILDITVRKGKKATQGAN